MAIHKDLTGATAVHPFFYPSESDPTSTLGAHKGWVKMSTGELKIRNAANTAWIELKSAVDLAAHLTDTVGAHAASAISVLDTAGNFAGTEVETVLDELYDTISSGSVPDATETVKGKAEIATQTETNTGTDDTRIVTPAKLAGRTSTDTRAGVIEIATQTETDTGTDDTRAVTPAKLAGRGFERTANKNTSSGYPGLGASPGTPDGTKFLRDDGTWQSVTGGGGGSVPDATETVKGIAEIATQAETNTGTDDSRFVTPLKHKTFGDANYATIAGGFVAPVTASSSGTVAATTHTELVSASGGTVTRTLPTAVGRAGKRFTIVKTDSSANFVAVGTTSSQTINGAAPPWNIRYQSEALTFESDNANWQIVSMRVLQNLDDIHDVAATSPTTDDLLTFDGTNWVPIDRASVTGGSGYAPDWAAQTGSGSVFAAWGDGDPSFMHPYWNTATGFGISATGATTTSIHLIRFRLPKTLAVSNLYAYSETTTTGVFTFAIYRVSDGVRMWDSGGGVNTAATSWNNYTTGTPFTLAANTNYWMAMGATTTGATVVFRSVQVLSTQTIYGNPPGAPLGDVLGLPVPASVATTAGAMPSPLGTVAGDIGRMVPFFLMGTAS